jgi:hypothetical protein
MSKEVQISDRVTIMIDTEVQTKVRKIQAFLITDTNCNWSFSEVLNRLLIEAIKTGSPKIHADKIIKQAGAS